MDDHQGPSRDDDDTHRAASTASNAAAEDAAERDATRHPCAASFQHWSPQGLPVSTGWCY